jgi:hypothetical protein
VIGLATQYARDDVDYPDRREVTHSRAGDVSDWPILFH